jgi:hypothetical protein
MDYSDDSCMTEFTPDQTVAMIASYIDLRAVPGSIMEVADDDESGAPANSTSDNLSQQSETTVSNNVDDGSEPSESEVDGGTESVSFGSGTSENTSTDNSNLPQSSNDGGFSSFLGFPQSTSSGDTGGSGLFFTQNNAGTSASLSSIFGSFGSGDGGGGGGNQELVPSGSDYSEPTVGIFTLSSITIDTAPSPAAASSKECTSLKAKGESCSSGLQCCSGVCAGIFFFDKCA